MHQLYETVLVFHCSTTSGSNRPPGTFFLNRLFSSAQFNCVRPHVTLLMMGSHSLADLRDAICCVSDLQVFGEFSHTPDIAPDFISKASKRTTYLQFTAARLKKKNLCPSVFRLTVQLHVDQVIVACLPAHACTADYVE